MLTPLNLQGTGQNSASSGTGRRDDGGDGGFNALLRDVRADRATLEGDKRASGKGEAAGREGLSGEPLPRNIAKEVSDVAKKERLAPSEQLLSRASSLLTSDDEAATADALRAGEKATARRERALEGADALARDASADAERTGKIADRQVGRDEGDIDFAASRSQRQALAETLGQLQGNRLEKAARADADEADGARQLKDAATAEERDGAEAEREAADLFALAAPGLLQQGAGAGTAADSTSSSGKSAGAVRQALAEANGDGRGSRERPAGDNRDGVDLLTRAGGERDGRASARSVGDRPETGAGALFGAALQRLDSATAGAAPREGAGAGTATFDSMQGGVAAISGQAGSGAAVAQSQAVTTATLPAMESDQWSSALERQTLNLSLRGGGEAKLALNPAELGPMTISLRMAEQGAQLHIASHHAQVRAAVEAALPQLREAFGANGIELGQASVSDQSAFQQSGGFQGQGDGSTRQGAGAFSAPGGVAGPEEELVSIAVPNARSIDGSIDLFA